jgi:FeS assembly SUF system regulator
MLRLSKMADYGTVVMSTMIGAPERTHSAAEIGAAIHVPLASVSKILKTLARGGLLVSSRGAKGGYTLARPSNQISLVDIIDVMDGPVGMTECSVTPGLCALESGCAVRANWQRINRAMLGLLREITLDQMIAPVARPLMQARQASTQAVDVSALGAVNSRRSLKPAPTAPQGKQGKKQEEPS